MQKTRNAERAREKKRKAETMQRKKEEEGLDCFLLLRRFFST